MTADITDQNVLYSIAFQGRYLNLYCQLYQDSPFLVSFVIPFWRAMRTYWSDLEVRESIWSDTGPRAFIRRSPSWGFPGVSLVVRQIPGDLCTPPLRKTSLTPLSLADRRYWRDIRGKWPLVRNPDRRCDIAIIA
jgi:hypothetical protein